VRGCAYNFHYVNVALGGRLAARFLGRVGAALWLLSSCVGVLAVAAKDNVLQEGSEKT